MNLDVVVCFKSTSKAARTSSRTLSSRSENREMRTGVAELYSSERRSGRVEIRARRSLADERRIFQESSSSSE